MTEKLRDAVTNGKSIEEFRKIANEEGMTTLWDNCKKLVLKGVTDISELMSLFNE
jgi:type II secretory ATPase GspE/PulE/Tfp pilus assembly ATPase PilB-like protein